MQQEQKHISEAVVRRLPKYYRMLEHLNERGVARVSSSELARLMGLNASQIRQDFNCFGDFGQQGYGYQIAVLLREFANILHLNRAYTLCVVGVGNLGKALLRYYKSSKDDFRVVSAFDIDPEVIGRAYGGVTVRPTEEMAACLAQTPADIVAICTPKDAAETVMDIVVAQGVKAVWNFTSVDLASPKAFVENAHLNDNLFVLAYRMGGLS